MSQSGPLLNGRFSGNLYRALNPIYAREPLSGKGAELHGGRFNPKGVPALYAALDPATAIREANQVGDLQPTMLVSYSAEIGPIFDGTDADELKRYAMNPALLGNHVWRRNMLNGIAVPTQDFAMRLVADGYAALLVASFARGGSISGLNLVLWDWSKKAGSLLVIDREDRLKKM